LPTGLRYSLTGTADSYDIRTHFFSTDKEFLLYPNGVRNTNEYPATAGITLKQPLLRNFWIDAPRLNIRINKKNLKIAELALRQQIMNTVAKVEIAYYELIFTREKVKVEEKALELARQLLADNRMRLEAGKLRPLEEKQSEAQVAAIEADLIAARQARIEQQNALKILVSDDFKAGPTPFWSHRKYWLPWASRLAAPNAGKKP